MGKVGARVLTVVRPRVAVAARVGLATGMGVLTAATPAAAPLLRPRR
ncbi:MAG: hypothetical protein WCA29_08690 [Jiangellales bacterium]